MRMIGESYNWVITGNIFLLVIRLVIYGVIDRRIEFLS